MSLIDSDMFYWRQKKCFSMIDKVKNVTTLIIYSSASQKTPKPKTIYIIHLMQWRKESIIWQPILADGTKCTFSIFWKSYVVYVDKKKNNCNISTTCHKDLKFELNSKVPWDHAEQSVTNKNHFYGFKTNNGLHVFFSNSSTEFWGCPRMLQQSSAWHLYACARTLLSLQSYLGGTLIKTPEIFLRECINWVFLVLIFILSRYQWLLLTLLPAEEMNRNHLIPIHLLLLILLEWSMPMQGS